MNTYSFNVRGVIVISGNDGDFKTLISKIKDGLDIKTEDFEQPHPKEIERLARMQAMEDGRRNNGRRYGDGGMPSPFIKAKKWSSMFQSMLAIVAGDSGIGFNSPAYYKETFEKLNKILKYNDSYVVFVRGNHDNPAFFDGEQVNFSNLKAVPDYSVLNVGEKNILCVGGAVSVDRIWRKKQEERINKFIKGDKKTLYFENEIPVFNDESINEIAKSTKIDYVVSHSAPSFVMPETKDGIDGWVETDPAMIKDMQNERLVFDKIFEVLRDNDSRPSYWIYSHFNNGFIEKRSDTIFRSITGTMNPINIENDIAMFNITEIEKKKKGRKKKMKVIDDDLTGEAMMPDAGNIGGHIGEQIEEARDEERLEDPNPFDNAIGQTRNPGEVNALLGGRLNANHGVYTMPNFGNAADATRLVNEEPQPHNHHAQTLYERFRAEFEQRRVEREREQQNEWERMFDEPTIEVVNNGNGRATIQYTFNDAVGTVATAGADGTVAE